MPKRFPSSTASARPNTTRDAQVLAHVARNRLTTVDVVRKCHGADLRPSAVGKLLRRLCRAGQLNKYPLYGSRTYFVLGHKAVRALGLPSGRCRPLGPQSLPVEFAALKYITSCPQTRTRLTRQELAERLSWLPSSLTAAAHCLDTSNPGQDQLELLRVDLGARADHLARKSLRDVMNRKRFGQFEALTSANGFRVVILTTSAPKANAIRDCLKQQDWPRDVPVHVAALRELASLIGGTRHAP